MTDRCDRSKMGGCKGPLYRAKRGMGKGQMRCESHIQWESEWIATPGRGCEMPMSEWLATLTLAQRVAFEQRAALRNIPPGSWEAADVR